MNDQFTLDPALVPIVEAICATLGDREVILIGGAVLTGYPFIERATDDLDLCVLIDESAATELLTAADEWMPGVGVRWKHVQHGYQVDVLPLRPGDESDLRLPTGRILSRVGMGNLHAVAHSVDGLPSNVRCAPIFAIALLKMASWLDGPHRRQKDLPDVLAILKNYEEYTDRLFDKWRDHQKIEECNMEQFGAYLLGHDIAGIASIAAARVVREFEERPFEDTIAELLRWLVKGFDAQWSTDQQQT